MPSANYSIKNTNDFFDDSCVNWNIFTWSFKIPKKKLLVTCDCDVSKPIKWDILKTVERYAVAALSSFMTYV